MEKEMAKVIEHTFYTLEILEGYFNANSNIYELNSVEYLIRDLFNKIDKMYAEIIEEEIIWYCKIIIYMW